MREAPRPGRIGADLHVPRVATASAVGWRRAACCRVSLTNVGDGRVHIEERRRVNRGACITCHTCVGRELRIAEGVGPPMLRSGLVCLGALAALHGPCGGGRLASEPVAVGDAGENGNGATGAGSGPGSGSGPSVEGGAAGAVSGGPAAFVTLASGQACPWGMAVDSTSVYWTTCGDPTGGFVLKVPKVGGTVTTLASGDRLSGIAVEADSVYWIAGSADASNPGSGAVMRVPPSAPRTSRWTRRASTGPSRWRAP